MCLFYKSMISAWEVPMPVFKSRLEILAVCMHATRHTALVIVFYRPGSMLWVTRFLMILTKLLRAYQWLLARSAWRVMSIFISSSGYLNRPQHHQVQYDHREPRSTEACPIVLIIYLTFSSRGQTVRSTQSTSRNQGYEITRSSRWPSTFSFSMVRILTACVDGAPSISMVSVMIWVLLRYCEIHQPMRSGFSPVIITLCKCHSVKVETRKLERVHRHNESDENSIAWRKKSRVLRFTLQQRYIDFGSLAINSNIGDPTALWSKINLLLKAPQASTTPQHRAEDFAVHFWSKVDAVRCNTLGALPQEY